MMKKSRFVFGLVTACVLGLCGNLGAQTNITTGSTISFSNAVGLSGDYVFQGGTLNYTGNAELNLTANNFRVDTSGIVRSSGFLNITTPLTGYGTLTFEGGNQLRLLGGISVTEGQTLTLSNTSTNGSYFFGFYNGTSGERVILNGGNFFTVSNSTYPGNVYKFGAVLGGGDLRPGGNTAADVTTTYEVGYLNGENDVYSGVLKDYMERKVAVKKVGTGKWTWTGEASYTGDTTIAAGTLQVGDASKGVNINSTTNIFVESGAKLVFANNSQGQNAVISGAGELEVTGGTVTYAKNHTFTGSVTVTDGTLSVGSMNESSGINLVSATSKLKLTGNGMDITSPVSITGAGALEIATAKTVRLTNTNITYTGGTILTSGVLEFNATNTFLPQGTITMNGGTLKYNGANVMELAADRNSFVLKKNSTLDITGNRTHIRGKLSGAGTLTKTGMAQVRFFDIDPDEDGVITLATASEYIGFVDGASSERLALGTGKFYTVSSGADSNFVYDFGAVSKLMQELRPGQDTTVGTTTTYNFGALGRDDTISANIRDYSNEGGTRYVAVNKVGDGTLTFNAATDIFTWSGDTNVNAGTLAIAAGSTLKATNVYVNSDGTITGAGKINKKLTIKDGGTLELLPDEGALTVGSVDFQPGALLEISVDNPHDYIGAPLKLFESDEAFGLNNLKLANNSAMWQLVLSGDGKQLLGSVDANAVPEPGALVLFLFGFLIFLKPAFFHVRRTRCTELKN